jgi:hypothetical protein
MLGPLMSDESESAGGTGRRRRTKHVAPVPPPFLTGSEDVFFWRADPEGGPGREFEDIMLRRVPSNVAHRFRGAAGARALTHAQYLSALVALHEVMRKRADGGNAEAAAVLGELGLGTVSI